MSINRYNYEEYFLLYVDNELSAAEREQVEYFVEQNPDLEEELTMLKQSQLKPDASLILEDKSSLFKTENASMINLENYETFFLLYVDEELNAEGRRAVELFASQHPAQQQELEILLQARITPDEEIIFAHKGLLYRREEREKVVVFKVWRIVAVAAMVILAIGIFWLNSDNQKQSNFAKGNLPKGGSKKDVQVAEGTSGSSKTLTDSNEAIRKEEQLQNIAEVREPQLEKDKSPAIANVEHVSHPEEPKGMTEEDPIVHPRMIAQAEPITAEAIGSKEVSDNVLIIDQPYEQPKANETARLTKEEGVSDEIAVGPVQTKNKFRGLLRRVSRVVEKNTQIPGGENKKLLIGNLEIALK